jgi:virginiamycin B lyase
LKKKLLYIIISIFVVIGVSAVLLRSNTHTAPLNGLEESRKASIDKFQNTFCGLNTELNSNEFVTEYNLPATCEMPLGIGVTDGKVWYVSTKNGTLGVYNIQQNSFAKEVPIPIWKSRLNHLDFSQVWAIKPDGKGNIWFTDEKQNAVWKYTESSQTFEMYKVPSAPKAFDTTYPVSLGFDSNGNIYFVGIRSTSLWFGEVTKMRNGTSDGISAIPMPIDKFSGVDPTLISTGSLAVDNDRNVVWISMLAFQKKGEILRYDVSTKTFKIFDMPEELASPVGIVVDDSGNLWITDHGTSIFYKLDTSTGNITKFVTSKASPRIFGIGGGGSSNSGNSKSSLNINDNDTPAGAYTLPYWIQKSGDGSLWFNEHTGNKIARFDPVNNTLIEYWIPTQNKLFGMCQNNNDNDNAASKSNNQKCGIANALQFSVGQNKDDSNQVWFTEWSENKIGKVHAQKQLPFKISTPMKEVAVKRGESLEVKVNIDTSTNQRIHMIAAGTFTPTGDLGNSTGSFSEESFSLTAGNPKQVSFIFTPSSDLKAGVYMLMIGAENNDVSYLKAVRINIT